MVLQIIKSLIKLIVLKAAVYNYSQGHAKFMCWPIRRERDVTETPKLVGRLPMARDFVAEVRGQIFADIRVFLRIRIRYGFLNWTNLRIQTGYG